METIKKYLPWTVRILIFALFMLSGIAKMFPLWAFEKQLVDLGLVSWCNAHYLARLIIALEIAIGIGILQSHFLKKLIIPATILLLVAFCVHLTIEMVKHGAMNGNCGCFGQLIPMTPLEAFIKNIITILLLIYLYRNVQDKPVGENKLSYLWIMYLGSALLVFLFFPFCPCEKESTALKAMPTADSTTVVPLDTAKTDSAKTLQEKVEKFEKPNEKVVDNGPKKVTSRFAGFTHFGKKTVNLDEGKKIVCMFAPGCDHCQATAKELGVLARQGKIPPVFILFMEEEVFKIPEFFKIAEFIFPHYIVDVPKFWQTIGEGSTPGVFYLWNGNIIKSFQGIKEEKFEAAALLKAIK